MRLPRPWPRLFWRWLKRLTPTSLFGRSLLIMLGNQTLSEALFYYCKLEEYIPKSHLVRLIDQPFPAFGKCGTYRPIGPSHPWTRSLCSKSRDSGARVAASPRSGRPIDLRINNATF